MCLVKFLLNLGVVSLDYFHIRDMALFRVQQLSRNYTAQKNKNVVLEYFSDKLIYFSCLLVHSVESGAQE